MTIHEETSAGGIVFKKDNKNIKWLIIQDSLYGNWGFPKGHVEGNEEITETALREVEEETGVKARILSPITRTEYLFDKQSQKIHKIVYYFLMEYVGEGSATHGFETAQMRWASAEEVKSLLTFDNAKDVFEKALSLNSS